MLLLIVSRFEAYQYYQKVYLELSSVGRNTTSKLIKQVPHKTKSRSRNPVIYGALLWNALHNSIRKYIDSGELPYIVENCHPIDYLWKIY